MRLLIFPAILFTLSGLLGWAFADQLVFPEDYDEVVTWLRSHGDYGWLVGAGVILGDALLPLPSTPAMFAMGIIYGPFWGGLICGAAMVLAGLIGFGATRALGRRAALFLVGEKDLARTEAFYERWGMLAVIFGRAVGGPAEWAVILAGLSEMSVMRVFAGLCIGGFASGWVIAALGAYSVNEPAIAAALAIAFLGILLIVSRRMSGSTEPAASDA